MSGQKSNFYVDVRALHSEVTGSCYVCTVRFANREKKIFVVDFGMFQEKKYYDYNFKTTVNPEDISVVLLTHNHLDHVGRLGLLYHRGCTAKIYASIGTAMALPINLEDCLKIALQKKNRKTFKKGIMERKEEIFYQELFNREDIDRVYKFLVSTCYNEWISDENLPNVSFKFLPNAHLPGASMIWVRIKEESLRQTINLLFTGDWNKSNVFQGSFDFPEELREVPIHIITEATYGATKKEEIEKVFHKNVREAIQNSKIVLLPVISQYRAPEMLWHLKMMKEQGEIPYNTPVYFCGPLGKEYIRLYQEENFPDFIPERKDFLPSDVTFLKVKGVLKNISTEVASIHIATGGMGSNGPVVPYLRALLPCSNALIHFSSYCAEGTIGRKLQEMECGEEIKIGGVFVGKFADVKFTSEFSGHAKADELLDFIGGFKKIKVLMIAHGTSEDKIAFQTFAKKAKIAKEVTILDRENYVRLDPWGIVKKRIWR